jgi:hypothetical protein
MPPDGPDRTVVTVSGNHSLRDSAAVRDAVASWLPQHVTSR